MNARILLFGIFIIEFIYELLRLHIAQRQRDKPLPKEVSDIYDKKRYQTYLDYTSDNRKMYLVKRLISLIFNAFIIFGPFFSWVDKISNHVYHNFLITFIIITIYEMIISYIFSYYDTFKIEEKYGLNKKDKKEFNRSFFLEEIPVNILSLSLYLLCIYICEHMSIWTNGFNVKVSTAFFITLIIFLTLAVFVLFASCISLIVLKKQYTFTPLVEGVLKDKINALQSGSKKKVKIINVYDESKKSTQKNAFLLKFLWIREFGIADNFMNENSENELLAVLSHEIGHLKHKKNIFNYLKMIFGLCFFIAIVYFISNANIILSMISWVNRSFHLTTNNYYLLFAFYIAMLQPILFVYSVYSNNVTRLEEYEADREAVKNGYGHDLIRTFKQLSSDELINVNPSPIIEFLEYDHPGMYQRIKAIETYEKELKN